MLGAGAVVGIGVAAMPGLESDREILLGMAGPLAGAVATWVLVARTFATRPERLTALMIAAFGGKMVFYGAYVVVMLAGLSLRPEPFVASFTVCFIALYVVEALCMRRLFADHGRASL
jgi:hypothetical protein